MLGSTGDDPLTLERRLSKGKEDLKDKGSDVSTQDVSTEVSSVADEKVQNGGYFTGLLDAFGWKLLLILFVGQHLSKAFVNTFMNAGQRFILKEYAVNASQMAVYEGITRLPWVLKPIIGTLSDYFPIFGYKKGPYIVLSTIASIAALCTLSHYKHELHVQTVVILMFVVIFCVATVDLLTEARYATAIRQKPARGPDMISYVWGGSVFAALCGQIACGYLLKEHMVWDLFYVAILPVSLILIPICSNFLEEKKMDAADIAAQWERLSAQKECVGLAVAIVAAAITLLLLGLCVESKMTICIVSCCVLIVVTACFTFFLNPMIARVNAFVMLQNSLTLNVGSAAFYFMLDSKENFPNGPHFSVEFYAMIIPLVGSIFALIGVGIYTRYMNDWYFPHIFLLGNCVALFALLLDAAFFLRWNLAWGISDEYFVLGSTAFEAFLEAWLYIPCVLLLAHMCPTGLESIIFALLAGCSALGFINGKNIASFLLDALEIHPDGKKGHDEHKEFENLWIVVMIAACMSLAVIACIPLFIPMRKQNESIQEGEVSATHNSLYNRWKGRGTNTEVAEPVPSETSLIAPRTMGANIAG